jgi:putative ABC transport system permease protein
LIPWQAIQTGSGLLVQDERSVFSPAAWLIGLLAIACVTVLAGGRMAERIRRVGLLKAVGGSPEIVALALVLAVALAVPLVATLVPAIRGARTPAVSALADAAWQPRRRPWLIALSARLPVPLLLGLRLVARRPRRALLSLASVAVTATGVVAVLAFHTTARLNIAGLPHGLGDPVFDRDEQVLMVVTVVLFALAALNAICAAWATVLDTARASALARALGASPGQVTAGIAAAQVLPGVPGVLLGIPLGIGLFDIAAQGAGVVIPPASWLAGAALGTLAVLAVLAAIPARVGAGRPVSPVLQADSA